MEEHINRKFHSRLQTETVKMNLSWGIAAAGRITHDFVSALDTIENSKHSVVAVADVDGQRAREFAQRHQIPRHYDGFDALSLDRTVDVVYVGTLNPYHHTVVRLMLERGKHVLCEKPLCLSLKQAQELYALAERKGVFLMEGMWSRFFPSYERLRELLLSDSIGEVALIKVQHGFRATGVERISSRALGGSITLDIGLYALQLGQFIYGTAPIKIKASGTLNGDGVDVQSEFTLDYGNNRRLIARVSGLESLENDARIVGSKGEIKLSNYWCCTQLTRPNGSTESWPLPTTSKFDFHHTNSCGLRYEAEEVRQCIEKRMLESPKYTHAASLELIGIEDEIRRQIGVTFDDVIGFNK
ncbi:trans-1,2-dihydrobenzene-1,2-diol dehydrogenase [Scaptodrosophila lebanonensis]|uniref:Trans-1,2-dihydrobenzene-1,2-diol dehydrogenase n=1 Tax=Drosophila lebanonensis TaxID=7225 RepID=A0A6J2U681_DROLE|nr:trans-1,2-dihydrobenzene-1,2-diol dehydrogenase [Scaptodrosophila lebanonensis]